MKDTITVHIVGGAGIGKTAVARLVTEILRDHGFEVSVEDGHSPVGDLGICRAHEELPEDEIWPYRLDNASVRSMVRVKTMDVRVRPVWDD